MNKYNLSKIMLKAWQIYRKNNHEITFSEALHRAWLSAKAEPINAKRVEDAKAAANITEQTATYADWLKAGRKVAHGSKALFQAILIWGSRGDGKVYTASFFGESQTEEIAVA
ncbi:MAG: hypothetical protein LUG99_22715 [Lachnospiraceae bacterium]|nr:hypothetical protein [Lachnospiraceae bacterium]